MAKDKIYKSKNFVITCSDKGNIEAKRKKNKNIPDIDTDTPVFVAVALAPDIYECCELQIEAIGNLTKDEYGEILDTVETAIANYAGKLSFIRISAEAFKGTAEFTQALLMKKYFTDEADNSYLLHECEQMNYIATFVCLCIGIASGLSHALKCNLAYCNAIGIALGVALGSILNSSAAKKRAVLKQERLKK